MFYSSRDEKLDEAHLLNVHAVQLEPKNLSYRINTATVLVEEKQFPGAIGVLKAATKVAQSPSEVDMVQARIQQIEQFQAAFDRAEKQNGERAGQTVVVQTAGGRLGQTSVTLNAQSSGAQLPDGKTMVFRRVNGTMVGKLEDEPKFPEGDSTGPRHTMRGVLRSVQCSYPTVLAFRLEGAGKTITLYNNNYYKIVFTTANYEPDGDIKPCTGIEDMKASVKYAEVSDKVVDGQILSIELSK